MRHQDSHGLRSGTPILGLLPRKLYLKNTHAPQTYGSTASKRQNMEATNREISTCMDNMMWHKHTRERHKPSEEEETVPPAATRKDPGRSPGSQASQTEEDR